MMKKIFSLVLLCIALQTVRAQVPVNQTDSLALIDLYNKTGGSGWVGILGWKQSNGPVSSWSGVKVVNGRVSTLNLEQFGLKDSLPSSVGNLTALTSLRLGFNTKLMGSIPSAIGRLTNLALFDISECSLTGSIPDSLGYLVKDTSLSLGGNQLSGSIPSSLGNLTKVKTIFLQGNNLTGTIPSSFSNLISLESLYLANNQLSGSLPAVLGNMPNLQLLELDHNQFTGSVPTFFNKMISLKKLYISANQLSGSIPNSLSNFANLVEVFLDRNSLSGTIPDSLGYTTNLKTLYLDSNNLVEPIPNSFSASTTLNIFNVQRNFFTFASLENLASNHSVNSSYASQRIFIPIHQVGNTLSVSAGGTLANNTYKWYKKISALNTPLVATKYGDSTYTVTAAGVYFAQITNSIASKVTLTSHSDTITKLVTAPTLTSFSPNFGPTGTTVTIKGSSFTGTASVTFGNVAANSFTVVDDSTITAVVGNGTKGNVAINNGIGTASKGTFYYCADPVTKSKIVGGCTSVVYNGITYIASTTINDTVKNVLGCDSVYNSVSINITPIVAVTKPATLYGCTKVVYNGKTYTVSKIVKDTIKSVWGCDSVYNVVTLTISPVVAVTKPVTLVGCNSIVYNGKTYTTPTVVKDTTKSMGGCDSVYNIVTITFGKPTSSTVTATFCSSDVFVFNGNTYTYQGTYIVHLTNAAGCDSTITLNLNSTTSPSMGIADTIQPTCSGSLGSIVAHYYSVSQAFAGSLDTTDAKQTGMIVRNTPSTCTGKANPGLLTSVGSRYYDSYTFKNNTGSAVCVTVGLISYNTSAINLVVYNGSFNPLNPSTNYLGDIGKANLGTTYCKQMVAAGATFVVVVHAVNVNSAIGIYKFEVTGLLTPEFSIDSGATWQSSSTFNNLQAGNYNLFQRWSGTNCATAYFGNPIKLAAKSQTTSFKNASICQGDSLKFNGVYYSKTGTYVKHLINSAGCDSTATLVLTVKQATSDTTKISISQGQTYSWNGNVYSQSGTYILHSTNAAGCDSADVLILNIVSSFTLSGNIHHPSGKIIKSISVALSDSTNTICDSLGNYLFNVTNGSNYTVHLKKNNDITKANGVSTIDAALVQSHVLGKSLLNSPYKIIAADVSGDGKVSALDIVYIKRLILGLDTTFTGKRLWTFVDSSYQFPDNNNPFPYKDSISFTGLNTSMTNQTFIGMKLGDVNWDWNPAIAKPYNNTVNAVELSYCYSSDAFGGANEVRIPIKVKNFKEMMGMQFTLGFDAAAMTFKGIEQNVLNIEMGTNHLAEGKLSMLWLDPKNEVKTLDDNTQLMVLVFERTVKEAIEIQGTEAQRHKEIQIKLDGSVTSIEAFDKDYGLHGIVMQRVESIQPLQLESWVVAPNPTTEGVIHVQMNLKEHKTIVFHLVDVAGKVIMSKKEVGEKGTNSFVLRPERHIPEGDYYLKSEGMEGVKQLLIGLP